VNITAEQVAIGELNGCPHNRIVGDEPGSDTDSSSVGDWPAI
jgi:hypothetical protein